MLLLRHWRVNGKHYSQTCEHWLQNMDANEARVRQVFAKTYGADNVECW